MTSSSAFGLIAGCRGSLQRPLGGSRNSYPTLNGVAVHGGSINGPGAVVIDGMLYVSSGYVHIGTTPGNVLLAHSEEGR